MEGRRFEDGAPLAHTDTGDAGLDRHSCTIYGYHMSETTKTTVYLDSADYRRLQKLARAEGRATADLVREAVAVYASTRAADARPSSLGAGRSGRRHLSEQAESLLSGLGRTK